MKTAYIDKHVSLIDDCRQGCRQAQFEIYKLYAKAMFNISYRIVNHHAEAEDVLQESFLDAFTRIREFRSETTFGLWLKQIVINKSITYLRKRKMELVPVESVDIAEELEEDQSHISFQVDQVKKAIAELPDGYRVVLTLYLFEGYDHDEISHILNISENTSRTQYMRAKQRLHRLLEKKGEKDEQRN